MNRFTFVVPRYDRRGQPPALLVRDNLGLLAVHDGNDRIGGPEVNSDYLSHDLDPFVLVSEAKR
jgi:hypothetical protein